ncbi:MAG: conjugal transfer protein TraD [Patescibacteria group bacterium]
MNYQDQIAKLTDRLAQVKAAQMLKDKDLKNREASKSRRTRDRACYQTGAMVEKMGLLSLAQGDQELFLGVLAQAHTLIEGSDQTRLEAFKSRGKDYLPIGKKLVPVQPSSRLPKPKDVQ